MIRTSQAGLHMGFFAAMTLPFVLVALMQVRLRQEAVAEGYRLSQAEAARDGLRAQIRKAELQHAQGRTPQVLQQAAQRLGFEPPRPHQLLDQRPQVRGARAQRPLGT